MAPVTTVEPRPQVAGLGALRKFGEALTRAYLYIANRPVLACAVVAVLPVVVRVALLAGHPVPQPAVQDEFSYLLGADTFASGRLTNPPHPYWQHFESFHIIQQPTYASKYPPAQALMLAAGQLLGHPWIGVLLSVAIMGASLCWCLQGWLPPAVGFTGALLAALRLGTFSYWANSYWGGAVSAIGGALVIGALPRLIRRPDRKTAFVFALGAVILANSRPFEGAVVVATASAVLLYVVMREHRTLTLLRIAALPVLALIIPTALAMGYYNYRVTSNWLLLPYQAHQQQYAVSSPFLWQEPRKPPIYHHAVMEELWTRWDLTFLRESREHWAREFLKRIQMGLGFLVGPLLFAIVMVGLPHPKANATDRLTFPILMVFLGSLIALKAVEPHYFAPIAALVYVRFMNTAAVLWRWRPTGRPIGPILAMFAFEFVALQSVALFPTPPQLANFAAERNRVEASLALHPGQHLVVVRYGAGHSLHEEWVYNRADIDGSRIVWARDMGPERNRELVGYFRNREVWLLEPDKPGAQVVRYSEGVDQ